ncbi:MMPL family transporter [Arthrobacter sp. JSM 101049]|uniref:MMPL family transporter n=1 Tax=Arthrobacter sp. JSM 101049 TaxID=929097 RepID=UPI003567283D
MATFLYKLGRLAYRRRWIFVSIWAVVLLAIGLSAGAFMGKLTNSFSIPGTETQRALDKLKAEMPEFSGGSGSIVYQTSDGQRFTTAQKKAIGDALENLEDLDDVRQASNPFTTQDQLDDAAVQVKKANQKLTDGRKKLEDGKQQLADGKEQIAENKQKIADGRAELKKAQAKIDDGRAQLADGKAELAQGKQKLVAPRAKLANGRQKLQAAKAQLAQGQQQYDNGAAKLASGKSQLAQAEKDLKANEAQISEGRKQYEAGAQQLTKSLGVASLSQVPAVLDAAQKALEDDPGNAKMTQKQIDDSRAALKQLNATQKSLDSNAAKLQAGEQQLADQKQELAAGEKKLKASKKKLDAGWARIAASQETLDDGAAQLAAGQAKVTAGEREIAANQAKLDAGQQEIDENTAKLDAGEKKLKAEEAKLPAAEKELEEAQQKLEDGQHDLALGERKAQSTQGMRFVSEDGTTAAVNVSFTGSADALTPEVRDQIKDIANAATSSGVDTYFSKEIVQDISSIFGAAEIIGLVIAAVVLMVMLGTFVAAGLPLLMAVLGVGAGVGGTLALSSVIEMASITPALALMLGLAVGIDYSLFIVHRHRRQLLDGMGMEESIGRATGTSGNAVVFAGLTVIIALSALAVPALPFLSVLGLSAAFTVAMAVLIAISLTPALLGIIGTRLVSKRAWRKAAADSAAQTSAGATAGHADADTDSTAHPNAAGNRGWGAFVTKRPVLMGVVGVLLLGLMALPALQLRTALPDGSAEPVDSSAHQAYDLLSEKFGAGYNGPIIALADLPAGLDAEEAEIKTLDIADELRGIDGVVAAVPVGTNDEHTLGVLQIVPQDGPASQETEQVVTDIRNATPQIEAETGSHLALTGQVTAQIDVSERLAEVLPLYLGIVVGLSLVLLLLVFRSIVVPLLATVGFLLSLVAAFGATVAVYQWGWLSTVFGVETPGPIMSFLPILLTGILFGLAMDYQVFLVSGMRESFAHGQHAKAAVRSGFAHSAPVVTAAALIMTSVFAGFIFSHLTMIRAIGFSLAIGVVLDAFVVRMTITPAIMHLLGRHAWYIPKWLDRILPDVDVEGSKIAALSGGGTAGGATGGSTGGSGPEAGGPDGTGGNGDGGSGDGSTGSGTTPRHADQDATAESPNDWFPFGDAHNPDERQDALR